MVFKVLAVLAVIPLFFTVRLWVRIRLTKAGRTPLGMQPSEVAGIVAGIVLFVFCLLLYWPHRIELYP